MPEAELTSHTRAPGTNNTRELAEVSAELLRCDTKRSPQASSPAKCGKLEARCSAFRDPRAGHKYPGVGGREC